MKPQRTPSRPTPQLAATKRSGQAAPPTKPPRFWLRLLALTTIVIAMTAAFVILQRRPYDLCRQWESEARVADEAGARTLIGELDRYGKFGLLAVVRLLDCQKPQTAEAARETIFARFDALRRLESSVDAELLTTIADELQRVAARGTDPLPHPIVDTGWKLLETTGELSVAGRLDGAAAGHIMLACDEVVRRSAVERPRSIVDVSALRSSPPLPLSPSPTLSIRREEGESGRGGDGEINAAAQVTPAPLPAAMSAAPVSRSSQPDSVVEPPRSAANSAARVNPIRTTPDDSTVRAASASSGPILTPSADDDLQRLDAWTLFANLHDVDVSRVAATLQELSRRKFSPREIELGKHLTSDDPIERRRYTALLTSLAGVDAKPWLLKMSRDEDPEVRFEAASIMATSNDPELLAAIRELAHSDPDPRVRDTAERSGSMNSRRK